MHTENRHVSFHIYRYHLLPLDSFDKQIPLFPEKKLTYDQIKTIKNEIFERLLRTLMSKSNDNYPVKLEHDEDGFYLFKIAQKKTTTITQNFENLLIDNEPYVYVIFNNNPKVQKIAISENSEAFSSPEVVKNILKKIFRKHLEESALNIEIESLFDSVNFWNFVKKHENKITYINFQFIKPNLAEITSSLDKDFRNFADQVNSHESHITIKAPEKGVLQNVNKSNKSIDGLVDYSSEGGGSIKMKIKGLKKHVNTKEKPVILQIKEIDLEGPSEQVFKLYKSIVED